MLSAALVAVMMQFPVAVGVRVVEEIVQGPETLVKVIDPDPEPPEVVSERSLPKLAVVEVIDRDDWLAVATVTVLVVAAEL